MSQGSASQATLGPVTLNAPQAAANAATNPAAVLDDSVNGSTILHLAGRGAAPAIALNANAGSGGAPAATLDANATDFCGQITLKTGTGSWASGTQLTITLATPLQKNCYPDIMPANAQAGANAGQAYVTTITSGGLITGWNIAFAAADNAQHTWVWNYQVSGQ